MGDTLIALTRIITYVFLILGILSLLVAFILAIGIFLFGFELNYGRMEGYDISFVLMACGFTFLIFFLSQWRTGRRNQWW